MAATRVWTVEESLHLIRAYRAERARHLANSLCDQSLSKRDACFADCRKGDQRQMASLRRNWMPVLSVLAKAEG